MGTIVIWSDLLCPWSYVAVLRLHATRAHLDAETVTLDFRMVGNDDDLDPATVRAEVAVLAQRERRAFSSYDGATWPGSPLLAREAQRWSYSLGQDQGERFDLALRRGFFLHSRDLSRRDDVLAVAAAEGLDGVALAKVLDDGTYRAEVTQMAATAAGRGITTTPTVVLPDGAAHVNPGIGVDWVRGIPLVTGDHPSVYEEIVRIAAMDD